MALNIVIVQAHKDAKGNYTRPTRLTAKPEDIKFTGTDGYVQITGYKTGDTIPSGLYYVGFFDPDTKKFLGTFQPVPTQTIQ